MQLITVRVVAGFTHGGRVSLSNNSNQAKSLLKVAVTVFGRTEPSTLRFFDVEK